MDNSAISFLILLLNLPKEDELCESVLEMSFLDTLPWHRSAYQAFLTGFSRRQKRIKTKHPCIELKMANKKCMTIAALPNAKRAKHQVRPV